MNKIQLSILTIGLLFASCLAVFAFMLPYDGKAIKEIRQAEYEALMEQKIIEDKLSLVQAAIDSKLMP